MIHISWRCGPLCGVLLLMLQKPKFLPLHNLSLYLPLRFCNQALTETVSHKHLARVCFSLVFDLAFTHLNFASQSYINN